MLVKAYAKINLTLEIVGVREDGYHLLRSVMHAVDIWDGVTVEPAADIAVDCAELPPYNSVLRAAAEYRKATGRGAHISVVKRIPSEAGLGGASADAAAVLRGMNALYGLLSERELYAMGERIGADVPFCLAGGCCLAEGIGERLTRLDSVALPLLIVKPEAGVSTARLFAGIEPPWPSVATDAAVAAVRRGEAPTPQNALAAFAVTLEPDIGVLIKRLNDAGAVAASMTGSGSAVFGIFESEAAARAALPLFADCAFSAVTHTIC